MAKRVSVRFIATLIAVVVPVAFIAAPAQAAPKPKVTIKVSKKTIAAGANVKVTGKVTKSSKGATVTLQRKDGTVWVDVKTSKVKAKGKYAFTAKAPAGKHAYRVKVAKTKKIKAASSKSKAVTGKQKQSIAYPYLGQTIRVLAQTRAASGAPVELQEQNGSAWQQVASGIVDATGLANLALTASVKSLRFYVPAHTVNGTTYPAWTSPVFQLVTASAEVTQIFGDINARRSAAGKAPLILDKPLTNVSQKWTKHMFDKCVFKHNPKFAKQTPGKWKRAGENIAAGQTVTAVVDAWFNSPGHRDNMLGDYTHIGIGVIVKTNSKCAAGKRYPTHFTTNFAKY